MTRKLSVAPVVAAQLTLSKLHIYYAGCIFVYTDAPYREDGSSFAFTVPSLNHHRSFRHGHRIASTASEIGGIHSAVHLHNVPWNQVGDLHTLESSTLHSKIHERAVSRWYLSIQYSANVALRSRAQLLLCFPMGFMSLRLSGKTGG